jgi:hypothetical protein
MVLEYDYGSTSFYKISVVGESDLGAESKGSFPRKVVASGPAGYAKFSPGDPTVDLNSSFATLNRWAFVEGENVSLNLFQPPRKHNHGFLKRGNQGA